MGSILFENPILKVIEAAPGTGLCAVVKNKTIAAIHLYNTLTGFDNEIDANGTLEVPDDGYGRCLVRQLQKGKLESFGRFSADDKWQYRLYYDSEDEKTVMAYMDSLEAEADR